MSQPPHDEVPTRPTQRRATTLLGCLIVALILGALGWFAVTNTETVDDRGFLGMVAER